MSVRLDHGDETLSEVHEINVTPFIDVILVLLIIFMIAAPLATVDISVDLPAANAERTPRPDKPLFLTLKSDLSVSLEENTDPAKRTCQRSRSGDHRRQAATRLSARRQDRALWRVDEPDERFAKRRISARGFGRA